MGLGARANGGRVGFAKKMRTLTASVYSQESLSQRHGMYSAAGMIQPGRTSTQGLLSGGQHGQALPLSKSLPEGALGTADGGEQYLRPIDGPTVAFDHDVGDDDATGPAPPSGRAVPRVLGEPYQQTTVKRKKAVPWERDPRVNPTSRFFPTPNIDHLIYAEEV